MITKQELTEIYLERWVCPTCSAIQKISLKDDLTGLIHCEKCNEPYNVELKVNDEKEYANFISKKVGDKNNWENIQLFAYRMGGRHAMCTNIVLPKEKP